MADPSGHTTLCPPGRAIPSIEDLTPATGLEDVDEDVYPDSTSEGTSLSEEDTNDETEDEDNSSGVSDIRTQIQRALRPLEHDGPSIISRSTPQLPNPLLYVDTVGTMGLPISERDIVAIRAAGAEREQPGAGASIRIPTDMVRMRNAGWISEISALARLLAGKMLVKLPNDAVPILISCEVIDVSGLSHRKKLDSQANALCLDVHLPYLRDDQFAAPFHPGRDISNRAQDSDESAVQVVMRLPTVMTDQTPRSSLVLRYQILLPSIKYALAEDEITKAQLQLASLLEGWAKTPQGATTQHTPRWLVYPLGNAPGGSRLSLDVLSEGVQGRLRRMLQPAYSANVDVFLAASTRELQEQSLSDEYGGWDDVDVMHDDMRLRHVTAFDGEMLASELDMSSEHLLPQNYFQRHEADEDDTETRAWTPTFRTGKTPDYDGSPYEGGGDSPLYENFPSIYSPLERTREEQCRTKVWDRLAAVFVPKTDVRALRLSTLQESPCHERSQRVMKLNAQILTSRDDPELREELATACEYLLPKTAQAAPRSHSTAIGGSDFQENVLLRASDLLGDATLFKRIVRHQKCSVDDLLPVLKSQAGKLDWNQLQTWLRGAAAADRGLRSNVLTLQALYECMCGLYDRQSVDAWYAEQFRAVLKAGKATSKDAPLILDTALRADRQAACRQWVHQRGMCDRELIKFYRPLSLFYHAGGSASFPLEILSEAYEKHSKGSINDEEIRCMFSDVLCHARPTVEEACTAVAESRGCLWSLPRAWKEHPSGWRFVRLIVQTESLGLHAELHTVLGALKRCVGGSRRPELLGFCLSLCESAQKNETLLSHDGITTLFSDLIRTQFSKIGPEPQETSDWSRPRRGCKEERCRQCSQLDEFLQDSGKQRMVMGAGSRNALHHPRSHLPPNETNGFTHRVEQPSYGKWVLKVNKIDSDWKNNLVAWRNNRDKFIQALREFHEPSARNMLGDQTYGRYVDHKAYCSNKTAPARTTDWLTEAIVSRYGVEEEQSMAAHRPLETKRPLLPSDANVPSKRLKAVGGHLKTPGRSTSAIQTSTTSTCLPGKSKALQKLERTFQMKEAQVRGLYGEQNVE